MDNDVNVVNRIASCSYQKGEFYSETDVRIDGVFIGNIYCTSKIVVGECARIEGQIVANAVDIYGKVRGNIFANELMSLRSTADVEGAMSFKKIQIEIGAEFVGPCSKIAEGEMNIKIKEIFLFSFRMVLR